MIDHEDSRRWAPIFQRARSSSFCDQELSDRLRLISRGVSPEDILLANLELRCLSGIYSLAYRDSSEFYLKQAPGAKEVVLEAADSISHFRSLGFDVRYFSHKIIEDAAVPVVMAAKVNEHYRIGSIAGLIMNGRFCGNEDLPDLLSDFISVRTRLHREVVRNHDDPIDMPDFVVGLSQACQRVHQLAVLVGMLKGDPPGAVNFLAACALGTKELCGVTVGVRRETRDWLELVFPVAFQYRNYYTYGKPTIVTNSGFVNSSPLLKAVVEYPAQKEAGSELERFLRERFGTDVQLEVSDFNILHRWEGDYHRTVVLRVDKALFPQVKAALEEAFRQ